MTLTLCVLLHATPGGEARLAEYEDQVLALLDDHGGRLVQRLRNAAPGDGPSEVHVIEFPSEAALQRYMDDPARQALTELRERAIARTEVLRVQAVGVPETGHEVARSVTYRQCTTSRE